MSAWGNKDDVTSVGTVDLSGLTVSNSAGVSTFFANNLAVGQVIRIVGAGSGVISSITDETTLTLVSNTEIGVGSITGAQYTVAEKPVNVVDGDTNMIANNVFGVDTTEATLGIGRVTAITISTAGTGYVNNEVVTISGGTSTVAANATVTTNDQGVPASVALGQGGRYSVLPDTPAATTGGSGSDLTLSLTFSETVSANVTHAGWVHRVPTYTDADGNVRNKSETLVAMSTITSDADDDAEYPEA